MDTGIGGRTRVSLGSNCCCGAEGHGLHCNWHHCWPASGVCRRTLAKGGGQKASCTLGVQHSGFARWKSSRALLPKMEMHSPLNCTHENG